MAVAAARAARRRRERDIVEATKALWDERGMQEARVDQIARAVGINRALIYRHFESKEELFVLTVTRYLADLSQRLRAAVAGADGAVEQFDRLTEAYADFCLEYPAFLDCALSLMRRPAGELREVVSGAVWFRLGQGMADNLSICADVLAAGGAEGAFAVDDPDFTANQLYTSALGTMHLARIGVGVRQAPSGVSEPFPIDPAAVRQAVIDAARAVVGLPAPARP